MGINQAGIGKRPGGLRYDKVSDSQYKAGYKTMDWIKGDLDSRATLTADAQKQYNMLTDLYTRDMKREGSKTKMPSEDALWRDAYLKAGVNYDYVPQFLEQDKKTKLAREEALAFQVAKSERSAQTFLTKDQTIVGQQIKSYLGE